RNWTNRYALESRPGKLVHHSDYRSVPREWLGPRFLADAEHLRDTNPTAYRHEYLGEVVGSGTQVFENLRLEPIPADLRAGFDRPLHGVDWGYYPDPWAYNGMQYDAARRILYIYDEATARRRGNQETAALLLTRGLAGQLITADSAEPKSIGDYNALGLLCRAAAKGPGSVEYSYKWLQSLACIWIDPDTCPDTAREFGEYEYERDKKSGEILGGYPDINNHHIDAVRYGTESIWKRRGL
ncbi:terminase, partial [Anaerofilum sp. An201]